jgi:hypothetical protein
MSTEGGLLFPTIAPRCFFILLCFEYGKYGMTATHQSRLRHNLNIPVIRFADPILHADIKIKSSII